MRSNTKNKTLNNREHIPSHLSLLSPNLKLVAGSSSSSLPQARVATSSSRCCLKLASPPQARRKPCRAKLVFLLRPLTLPPPGIFNSTQDYASSFDGDGHGTHTAAGNHGIPVIVTGHHLGNASGMAPCSRAGALLRSLSITTPLSPFNSCAASILHLKLVIPS
ncbi:hypothetical protein Ahy_B01g056745 isoform A [Arachis hypogaea]|uniref:Uncharacterized protein n=1 Tax=Arachis hypogaea TaxID=3818 RepID=A0A445AZF7_ARAHY|nr:hypothetical protein Ahy_B01g056745 isoform A [Arachis hypogaea]